MQKRYDFLEHTADAYIAAYGKSLEEAFENAALATFEVMTDVKKVKPLLEENVEVEAHDEYALLYNWLEELVVRFEVTNNLFSQFKISVIQKKPDGLKLKAKIWGDSFDPNKHVQRVGVKAVTYHKMEIVKEPEAVTIKFILDI